jgi:hypothetical protein
MKYQRGVSLNALLVGGGVMFLVALLAMKVAPVWMEFGKITKAVQSTALEFSNKETSVSQIQAAYDKRAEIDQISEIKGVDLDITKEGNQVVIQFAYQSKVPLFKNVSLLFDFEGNSAAQ